MTQNQAASTTQADGSAPQPDGEIYAFEVDGNNVRPTAYAEGPWFAGQLHGAAVIALLVRFMELAPTVQPMRFTRITVDISKAVPMTDLVVEARALRDGKRVQSLGAEILADGDIVARAFATRIRIEPGLVPDELRLPLYEADKAPPLSTNDISFDMGRPSFHECLGIRSDDGNEIVNSQTWFRLAHNLVKGETPTPAVRMASVADMIMSSSTALGPDWISINPEVTMQVERYPTSEWLCVRSTVRFGDDGVGNSDGIMFDESGRIGSSGKSVLNMPRKSD